MAETSPQAAKQGAGATQKLPIGDRLERVAGIEPARLAWKARALPLHHTRARHDLAKLQTGVKTDPKRWTGAFALNGAKKGTKRHHAAKGPTKGALIEPLPRKPTDPPLGFSRKNCKPY